MIKVDGHDCWHEILNNKRGSILNTVRILNYNLKQTNSICVEVSWLNLYHATSIVQKYLPTYPNIKYVLFYKSPIEYLNPNYGLEKEIDKFNTWIKSHKTVKTEFLNLSNISPQKMNHTQVHQSMIYLSKLFWHVNTNEYFDTNDKNPNGYYTWYKVLKQPTPNFSVRDYNKIIKNNMVKYPEITRRFMNLE